MLPLLLLLSCAHSPYFENDRALVCEHRYLRQCSLPLFIGSAPNLTDSRVKKVSSAVEHWNNATGMKMFFDLGVIEIPELLDEPNDAFVLVSVQEDEEMKDKLCGVTHFRWDQQGCMHFVSIRINPKCLEKGDEIFETIVRHEFGHVLGLTHINDFTKLMNPSIEETLQHPVDVSAEEIESIKNLYMR